MTRSFDFTDESYYWLLINAPNNYPEVTGVQNFGFVYNIFSTFGVYWLRVFNLLIYSFIFTIFFFLIRREITFGKSQFSVRFLFIISMTCIYFYPFGWISMPSYNSLVLQASTLFFIGTQISRPSLCCAILAFSLTLAYLAKPTSCFALLIVFSIFILRKKKDLHNRIISYLATIVCFFSFLVIYAIFIDGTIAAFINRTKFSLSTLVYLKNGPYFDFTQFDLSQVFFPNILIALLFAFLIHSKLIQSSYTIRNTFLISIFVVSLTSRDEVRISLVTLMFYIISLFNRRFRIEIQHKNFWILPLLPFCVGFGTDNLFWTQAEIGSIFSIVFLMYILRNVGSTIFLQLFIVVLLILLQMARITEGFENPYRQSESLSTMTHPIELENLGRILLSEEEFEVVKALQQVDVIYPSRVLDMSGKFPFFAIVSDIPPAGSPWTLGGYRGTSDRESFVIFSKPCKEDFYLYVLSSTNYEYNLSFRTLNLFTFSTFVHLAEFSYDDAKYSISRSKYRVNLSKCSSTNSVT